MPLTRRPSAGRAEPRVLGRVSRTAHMPCMPAWANPQREKEEGQPWQFELRFARSCRPPPESCIRCIAEGLAFRKQRSTSRGYVALNGETATTRCVKPQTKPVLIGPHPEFPTTK